MMIAQSAMLRTLEELAGHGEGWSPTPLAGVAVVRHQGSARARQEWYTPVLCLVLRGSKQVALDDQVYPVSAGQGLVVSIEVPVTAHIQASASQPYLATTVGLDLALLDEIAVQAGLAETAGAYDQTIAVLPEIDDRLLDCLSRIVDLTRRPNEAVVLMPGLLRELHYLLLVGPLGGMLRRVARPSSYQRRIGAAISLIRENFAEVVPLGALARAAGMSASAFHLHFKAVAGCSPRQFQKQLRLLEARRLMRMEGVSARHAAFMVGYASPQQFTRDHARRFGAPPHRSLRAATEPRPG